MATNEVVERLASGPTISDALDKAAIERRDTTPGPASIRPGHRDLATSNSPVHISSDADDELEPAPLADGWVIAGDPKPRMRVTTTSADGAMSAGVWCCEPSKFTFIYDVDEYVHIIKGRVTVVAGEHVHDLQPGSTVLFPQGLVTQWTVHEAVHKVFVLRNPRRWRRVARRLRSRVPVG